MIWEKEQEQADWKVPDNKSESDYWIFFLVTGKSAILDVKMSDITNYYCIDQGE